MSHNLLCFTLHQLLLLTGWQWTQSTTNATSRSWCLECRALPVPPETPSKWLTLASCVAVGFSHKTRVSWQWSL